MTLFGKYLLCYIGAYMVLIMNNSFPRFALLPVPLHANTCLPSSTRRWLN